MKNCQNANHAILIYQQISMVCLLVSFSYILRFLLHQKNKQKKEDMTALLFSLIYLFSKYIEKITVPFNFLNYYTSFFNEIYFIHLPMLTGQDLAMLVTIYISPLRYIAPSMVTFDFLIFITGFKTKKTTKETKKSGAVLSFVFITYVRLSVCHSIIILAKEVLLYN